MPKRKSRLLRSTAKTEDQIMDQNNGLGAKNSREETRTTITIGLGEIFPLPTRVSPQGQTSRIGTTVPTMEII